MLGKGAGRAETDKNDTGCGGVGVGRAATDGEGARADVEGAERAATLEDGAGEGATDGTDGEGAERAGTRRGGGRRTLGRPERDGCGRAGGRAGASLRAWCAVDRRRVRALAGRACCVVRISGAPATLAGCVDTPGRGSCLRGFKMRSSTWTCPWAGRGTGLRPKTAHSLP